MRRIVVLGAGTGVGKTWVSVALVRALRSAGLSALGLKPIESGAELAAGSDALELAHASAVQARQLYTLRDPISPHLAARRSGLSLSLELVQRWVEGQEAIYIASSSVITVVETAGGVFSPLGRDVTNFELAQSLEPAFWLLVAPDSLGVLHDLSATLEAMRARGRSPDACVLCQARAPDASTGTNAAELESLGIVRPLVTLARDDTSGIASLLSAVRKRYDVD